MGDNKNKDKDKEEDPRLEFISSYVMKSLRIKMDKWHKMMGAEDSKVYWAVLIFEWYLIYNYQSNQNLIHDWLTNPDKERLIINVNNAGGLMPSNDFPMMSKGKSCYFIRKSPVELNELNIQDVSKIVLRWNVWWNNETKLFTLNCAATNFWRYITSANQWFISDGGWNILPNSE